MDYAFSTVFLLSASLVSHVTMKVQLEFPSPILLFGGAINWMLDWIKSKGILIYGEKITLNKLAIMKKLVPNINNSFS